MLPCIHIDLSSNGWELSKLLIARFVSIVLIDYAGIQGMDLPYRPTVMKRVIEQYTTQIQLMHMHE